MATIDGIKIKILAAKKPVACRLIRPGTEAFFVSSERYISNTAYINAAIVDIYQRGMSNKPILKRSILPVSSSINGCYRRHVVTSIAFDNNCVDIENPYQIIGMLTSSFCKPRRAHYYQKYINKLVAELGYNIRVVKVDERRFHPAALPRKIDVASMFIMFLNILESNVPDRLLSIINNIVASRISVWHVLRSNDKHLFTEYSEQILHALVRVRARKAELTAGTVGDVGRTIERKYKAMIQSGCSFEDYMKLTQFKAKFCRR